MKIYRQEKNFEKELSVEKATASLTVPVKLELEKDDLFIKNLEAITKNGCSDKMQKTLAKIARYDHPELMYGSAILVSTVINKNDEMFLPEETWKAKESAISIPYNDDHIETDIIGHTIAVRPLDSEGNLIEGSEPPDYFDLEIDFVLYCQIFPALAKEIREKAPLGEKFVSLEAKFKDFDYGLVDSHNKVKIVARNEDTAFLTKYLRCVGGEGQYQDYRIARVLRDFRFSGIGNVDNPANPGSEYTRFDDVVKASDNEIREDKKVFYVTKGKIMKVETLEDAQKLIAELNNKLSQFEGQEADKIKAELETVKNEKTELANKLSAETEKVSVATNQIGDLNTKIEDLNKKVDELTKDRDTKAAELDKITKEAKASERVAELKNLGVEVDEAKRKEVAEWTDATFASVVEFTKSIAPEKKDQNGGGQTQANALDKVEENKDTDVSDTKGDEPDKVEEMNKVAAKLATSLRSGRNKSVKSNKKE